MWLLKCKECKQLLPKEKYYWNGTEPNYIHSKFCKKCNYKRNVRLGKKRKSKYHIRRCLICKFDKMLVHFPFNQNVNTNYEKLCIECKSKGYYRQCQLNEDQLICCTKCQKPNLYTQFKRDKRNYNGLGCFCKECLNQYKRDYYWKMKDEKKEKKTKSI